MGIALSNGKPPVAQNTQNKKNNLLGQEMKIRAYLSRDFFQMPVHKITMAIVFTFLDPNFYSFVIFFTVSISIVQSALFMITLDYKYST